MIEHPITAADAAVRCQSSTLFVSLELSRWQWLITVSAPGSEKLSKHVVPGGDSGALLQLLHRLQTSAARQTGTSVSIAVIQAFRRPGLTDSGFIGCLSKTESRATLSTPLRSR